MRGLAAGSPSIGRLFLTTVVVGLALALLGGCAVAQDRAVGPQRATGGQRAAAAAPAFEAGGACQLLDYATIRQTTGLSFSVAAAGQQGETFTCLVQSRGVPFPDLSISVTATRADEKVFNEVVVPAGATAVSGLGKAAYSTPVAAAGVAGPGVQVGWLAGNQRLMALRLRLAATASVEEAAAAGPKLTELAKNIDFSTM